MYHSVASFKASGELNVVSEKSFGRQMKFLKKHGYQVISLDDLIQGINRGVLFNRKSVVITFDDGYEDNYTKAFPILKNYGYPAIVFVVSSAVGTEGFLNWDQIREMYSKNILIGSHTRHHVYLPDIQAKDETWDEISNSKRDIQTALGAEVKYFSYPSGGYTEEIKEMVVNSKYKGACATNRGFDRFNTGVYELKRIRINNSDSAVVMWAKLSGYYNLFRRFKNSY
jgi:peptidoglycan/xylan/chitin deacetylase (PgdA/CDA1 family)